VFLDLLGQLFAPECAGPAGVPVVRVTLFLESAFSAALIPPLTNFLIWPT